MATITHGTIAQERRISSRRAFDQTAQRSVLLRSTDGVRVSWGGIWGGVLVALAVLMVLTSLGLAVGMSAVDPTETSAQSVGIGAALWGAVSLLLALFIGGLVATRIGATHDGTTSMFEGVLVWIVSVLIIAYLAGSGVALVATGAFKLVGGAAQTIGAAMGAESDLGDGSVEQMVRRLRDPQTAQALSAAIGIPENEVHSRLSRIADTAESAKADPAEAADGVRQSVREIVDRARAEGRLTQAAEHAKAGAMKTAWTTFGALILSLLAAVLGAMLGRHALSRVSRVSAVTGDR